MLQGIVGEYKLK